MVSCKYIVVSCKYIVVSCKYHCTAISHNALLKVSLSQKEHTFVSSFILLLDYCMTNCIEMQKPTIFVLDKTV